MEGNLSILEFYREKCRLPKKNRLQQATKEELLQLHAVITAELAGIRHQITDAKAHHQKTGVRADSLWFAKAKRARDLKARFIQQIQTALSAQKQARREQRQQEVDRPPQTIDHRQKRNIRLLAQAIEGVLTTEQSEQVFARYRELLKAANEAEEKATEQNT